MRLRDNDIGLLWDRAQTPKKAASRTQTPKKAASRTPVQPKLHVPRPLPLTTWTAPSEPPQLLGCGIRRLALDTETCDPDLETLGPGTRRGAFICGIAVGIDGGPRQYLPIAHEGGGNMDPVQVRRWAVEQLANFDGELVGANLLYDLDMLAEYGVVFKHVRAYHDVQVAEAIIDEWRFSYRMDDIAKDYLGEGKDETLLREAALAIGGYKGDRGQNSVKANLWRLPAAYVGPYAEGDVDRPLRILPLQLEKLRADDQLHIYDDIERPLIPMLLAMQRRGVRVDVNKAEEVGAALQKEIDRWTAEIKRLAGPKAELNSSESLVDALRARGVQVFMTKGGKNADPKPQIDKALFERNRGDELVRAIAAGRRVTTLKGTFIEGQIFKHSVRGRIHAGINQIKGEDGGTIARLSYRNPNLQAVPSRKGEFDDYVELGGMDVVKLVRGLFLPDEGDEWQCTDASQIEYRFLTHFAIGPGAEDARRQYRDDPTTDFHKLVAAWMGIDPEDKLRRKRVKNVNFAKGYGARAKKLAETMGCGLIEAQEFIDLYDAKLPFAKATFDKAAEWAQRRQYVETIAGRKARFIFWEPLKWGDRRPALPKVQARAEYGDAIKLSGTYKALNRKIQGSSAEHMKMTMLQVWRAGLCEPDALGPLLLTVHDELDASVPRTARGDAAGKELAHIMETSIKLSVPILAETKRGENWGDVS